MVMFPELPLPSSIRAGYSYQFTAKHLQTEADIDALIEVLYNHPERPAYYFESAGESSFQLHRRRDHGSSAPLSPILMDETEFYWYRHPTSGFVRIQPPPGGVYRWDWEKEVVEKGPMFTRHTLVLAAHARRHLEIVQRIQMEKALREPEPDPLTQLRTRLALDNDLAVQLKAVTPETPITVLFSDVDSFKLINDTFFHDGGDAVLRAVASCYRALCQHRGTAYRYAGDEFVVVLPNTGLDEARLFAERLRAAVEALQVQAINRPVTVSVGVAVETSADVEPAVLLKRADVAMYRSKHGGKNRLTIESDPE